MGDLTWELLYVDGGSNDTSMAIAHDVGVDQLLGGDQRRRAAENRNLGLAHATGRFIQFLDGDMTMAPDWPLAAAEFLETHDEFATVCGNLQESEDSVWFRALEIDWAPREGPHSALRRGSYVLSPCIRTFRWFSNGSFLR